MVVFNLSKTLFCKSVNPWNLISDYVKSPFVAIRWTHLPVDFVRSWTAVPLRVTGYFGWPQGDCTLYRSALDAVRFEMGACVIFLEGGSEDMSLGVMWAHQGCTSWEQMSSQYCVTQFLYHREPQSVTKSLRFSHLRFTHFYVLDTQVPKT